VAERVTTIEQFGKLKVSHKMLITGLLVALMAGIFYVVFYQDIEDKLAAGKIRKGTLDKELSEYTGQLKTKHAFQEQIQALYRKRQIALEKLPEDEEIPSLLQKIDGLGKIVGLQMSTFSRSEPIETQFYAVIRVNMEMVGSYNQIATFFDYIGKLTRIVNITNISLSDPKQDANGRVVVKATVLATTYRYKPEKKAEEPAPAANKVGGPAPASAPAVGGGH
jgi:type IV pilus assembly protein PilO